MKKLLLFGSFLIASLFFTSLNAQTSIFNTRGSDSTQFYCVNTWPTGYSIQSSLTGYTAGDSVEFLINFGDGTTWSRKYAIYGSPAQQNVWGYVQYTYTIPGNYNIQLIAIAPDNKRDTFVDPNAIQVSVCGNISGNTYVDKNSDCTFNSGDDQFRYQMIVLTDNTTSDKYYTSSDSTGYYEIDVPTGTTYTVSLHSPHFTAACPSGGHTSVSVPQTSVDIGIQCGTGFDVFGQLSGLGFRPGRALGFGARPKNPTCTPVSGKMKIVLSDPRISFHSSNASPAPTISGDTVIFNFTNLDYTNLFSYNYNNIGHFTVMTDTNATIGDTICVDVIVEPITGDIDPSNNTITYCFPVSNSFDPNDKAAQPLGYGPTGIIEEGTRLDYHVRFQNTGNDVAYDVFIMDTLSANLDLSTISFNGASHPMDWQIIDGNILKFNFKDINLPDSNSNEPESHGYVDFSINAKQSLAIGTEIVNKAAIYFDYNEPVITNEVIRTIGIITGIEDRELANSSIDLYPNPTTGVININIETDRSDLRVRNSIGQVVGNYNLQRGVNSIDMNDLPNGLYLMEFENNGSIEVRKVILN